MLRKNKMTEGLQLNMREFEKLPNKEQHAILYQNIEEIKGLVMGYKFNQKIQYAWLTVLTIALGLTKYLGIT